MRQINILPFIFCLFILSAFYPAFSQPNEPVSWNQFRGPDRNGIIYEGTAKIADSFPEEGPELLWKRELGAGFSEITIEGDRIYTLFGEKTDSLAGDEYMVCLDATSGNTIWQTKVDSMFFDTFGDGPRSTPVIGKHLVFGFSSYGKLTAFSKTDGVIVWQADVLSQFGSTVPRWGFSTSPVLVDQTLIVETGGSDSRSFIGLDAESGTMNWASGNGVASYCSPVVANIDGETQIIFANQNKLFSISPKGDTLWNYTMSLTGPTAMPVFFDKNKIFISSLQSKGFCIVEIKEGNAIEKLRGTSMKNDFSSSLYYQGHFYGFNVAALQCISAETGENKWTKRGLGKGSLILVGDKLLVLSDQGKIVMVKATPDSYLELGSFQALEGKSWTAPSFSNGKLFLRNLDEMACYVMLTRN